MYKKAIPFFGLIEIGIGLVTFTSIVINLLAHTNSKPFNVLVFVAASSLISICLGIGILSRFSYARKLIIFFAGWIILSKIFIFSKIITLCCGMEPTIPSHINNSISIMYHLMLIFYFHDARIKTEFKK